LFGCTLTGNRKQETGNRELSLTFVVRLLILFSILIIVNLPVFGQGQTRTKKVVSKKYFINGNLKSISETHTTLPKYIDPLNFYKKTKVYVIEYDSLTTHKVKEWTRIMKIGKDGKPCHEILYEEINYDQFGNRISYARSRCDKQKAKYKKYKNGKVDFVQIVKHRKR
jgi:hypothetical protein